jgi:formylmethanofuran--tetrahydromethanopterin N-formyltransferase
LKIGETLVADTFAEAFGMRFARLLITAAEPEWLEAAVREVTGYGASVISCDAEAGLERRLGPGETPDGRLGAAVLLFGFSADTLGKAIANRAGQCVMTCPTTALYDGLTGGDQRVPLGKHLRWFGDGYQKSKLVGGRRYWRIPVMDGEFLVEETVGVAKGVAGGNLILQATDQQTALAAARRGVEVLQSLPGIITPFPGGVVRSGSKVGSRYKGLTASTADVFCPTLRGRVESKLHEQAHCAYEIVIDGTDEETVGQAMAHAMRAIAGDGVLVIGAGNYGGKLGKYHLHLRRLL